MLDAKAQKDAEHHYDVNDMYMVQSVEIDTSSVPSVVHSRRNTVISTTRPFLHG